MGRQVVGVDVDKSGAGVTAPVFTARERNMIATWARRLAARGLHAGLTSSYRYLPLALQVRSLDTADPCWLVHKTPDGDVALRLWPGVAERVPTLAEALGRITAATARGPALAPLPRSRPGGLGECPPSRCRRS